MRFLPLVLASADGGWDEGSDGRMREKKKPHFKHIFQDGNDKIGCG